jgi:glycosyltransferase involved in cell wall biosynthesis
MMPIYNHEKTLQRALDSILKSDCSKIELILSDDCSLDNSFEVASKWLRDNKAKFFDAKLFRQQKNLGITSHLNFLVSKATGEYITGMASDDKVAAKSIDRQVSYLKQFKEIDFLWANCSNIDEFDNLINAKLISDTKSHILKRKICLIVEVLYNWNTPWVRLFARRTEFMKFGPYIEEHSFEDRWTALKILSTNRMGYYHEVVYEYRVRGDGTGTAGLPKDLIWKDYIDVDSRAFLESNGIIFLLMIPIVYGYRGGLVKSEFIRKLFQILGISIRNLHIILTKL